MTTTSTATPSRTTRRLIAASSVVVALASVVGFGGPAAADELTPAPVATFASSCDPYGHVDVTLSNLAGLSDAHFSVGAQFSSGGGGGWNIDVAAGDSHVLVITHGDGTYTLNVTADNAYTNSTVLTIDCTQTTGTIALVCHGEVPVIEANATTTGLPTTLRFYVDGNQVDESSTGTASFTQTVVNGAAFSAVLETSTDGAISDIAGTADCPPTIPVVTTPEPVVTTPEPVVTTPEPVGTNPGPVTGLPAGVPQTTVTSAPAKTASLPSPTLPTSPSTADTLPVTGIHSTAIAAIAAGLVGLGLLCRRASKHQLGR